MRTMYRIYVHAIRTMRIRILLFFFFFGILEVFCVEALRVGIVLEKYERYPPCVKKLIHNMHFDQRIANCVLGNDA